MANAGWFFQPCPKVPAEVRMRYVLALDQGTDKIPTGLIFQQEKKPFHRRLAPLQNQSLVTYPFNPKAITAILEQG